MADETKKVEETVERGTPENPKVLWKYVVTAKDVGGVKPLYDFEGLPIKDGDTTPSIDVPHIASDLVELGRRLDHQLTVEEAVLRSSNEILKVLQQQVENAAKTAQADATDVEKKA